MGNAYPTEPSTPHSNTVTPAPWGLVQLGLAALWAYWLCPALGLGVLKAMHVSMVPSAKLEWIFALSLVGWGLVLWRWYQASPRLSLAALGVTLKPTWKSLLGWTFLGSMGLLVLGLGYGQLQHWLGLPSPQSLLPSVPKAHLWVMGGLLAPISEEMVFRGAVLATFSRYVSVGVSITLSAVLFAALHVSYSAYPLVLVYVFLLALLLGGIRLGAKSLWPCVLTHALNNLLVLWWLS